MSLTKVVVRYFPRARGRFKISALVATGVIHLQTDATCPAPCLLHLFPFTVASFPEGSYKKRKTTHIVHQDASPGSDLGKTLVYGKGSTNLDPGLLAVDSHSIVFVKFIILSGHTLPHIQPAPANFLQRPRPALRIHHT